MARKLRIFADEEHPFAQHPQLVPWEMAPRRWGTSFYVTSDTALQSNIREIFMFAYI